MVKIAALNYLIEGVKYRNMELTLLFFIGFLSLFIGSIAYSGVTLPRVIGSNMVLQRDRQAPIWGWAPPGEEITITLSAETEDPVATTTAVTDADGNWQVKLPAMAAGGPYTLRIKGSNTLELTNVLFGEVWVCSGQSNMQWTVNISNNSEEEIAAAMYPKIRLFNIPQVPSGLPQQDVEADWYVKPHLRRSRSSPPLLTISDGSFIRILTSRSG